MVNGTLVKGTYYYISQGGAPHRYLGTTRNPRTGQRVCVWAPLAGGAHVYTPTTAKRYAVRVPTQPATPPAPATPVAMPAWYLARFMLPK
jgi:hypothetical protein